MDILIQELTMKRRGVYCLTVTVSMKEVPPIQGKPCFTG